MLRHARGVTGWKAPPVNQNRNYRIKVGLVQIGPVRLQSFIRRVQWQFEQGRKVLWGRRSISVRRHSVGAKRPPERIRVARVGVELKGAPQVGHGILAVRRNVSNAPADDPFEMVRYLPHDGAYRYGSAGEALDDGLRHRDDGVDVEASRIKNFRWACWVDLSCKQATCTVDSPFVESARSRGSQKSVRDP